MQLASDAGRTDIPLLDETIGANLARTVAAHGDVEALVARHQGVRWTYAELGERVARCARGLLGLGPGGRRPGRAVEPELRRVDAAAVRHGRDRRRPRQHQPGLPHARAGLRARTSRAAGCCSPRRRSRRRTTSTWSSRSPRRARPRAGDVLLGRRLGRARGRRRRRRRRRAGRPPGGGCGRTTPINIQYTSGTTGFPKGATLTHRNILNNGYFVARLQGFQPGDRLCIPVPFYHCFGMVMGNLGCTTHGATMVIPSDAFDPTHVLETVEAERCTALYGVPTMFIAELAHPEFDRFDLSSLRTGVMAGSPCPVEVMKACVDRMHMVDVTICYGMTETSPVSTQTLPDDSLHHRTATVGRAHPHVEIRIADPETGETLERGATGEFCTRGYSVMRGYWNDAERTADAIDADGWMHTGDLAVMADDGYVNIVGRIKDMVIRGGENVYPREVEEFLYTHPDVEDVQVIGVPDERYGEELMAWVRLRPGADGRSTRGAAGVLPGPHRPLQGPPLRQVRRRVPDDRHRQGAEVQDARDRHRRARPDHRRDGLTRVRGCRIRSRRLERTSAPRVLSARDRRGQGR